MALALVLGSAAVAAPPTPEAQARAAAGEAKKAFDLGRFDEAIAGYEEAYRLKPAPGLLFNLGQSHRRAGNLEKATFYFRRYLETNPPAAQARATEEVLAQVQTQLEARRRDEEAQQRAALMRAAEEEQRRQEELVQAQQLQLEQARLSAARAEREAAERKLALEASLKQQPPPTPVTQRWWFWGALGLAVAGGVAAATAVALAPQPTVTTFPDIDAR